MLNIEKIINSTINSVPIPYMGTHNLTITFLVETGQIIIDSVGNEAPVKVPTIVKASIHRDRSVETQMNGTGLTSIALAGRCQGLLPASIDCQTEATAEWLDKASAIPQKGRLKLTAIVPDRFSAIEKRMGTYIECNFVVKAN